MDAELKKQWVEALRSGNYKQCTEQLRDGNPEEGFSYCCLGVLADLLPDAEWAWDNSIDFTPPPDKSAFTTTNFDSELPVWLFPRLEQQDLIVMNDDMGESFATIADYIEANVEVDDG
jgi:hypothetical protein